MCTLVCVVYMCKCANVGESDSFAILTFQVEHITAGRKKPHKTGTCDWADIDTGGGEGSVRVDQVGLHPPKKKRKDFRLKKKKIKRSRCTEVKSLLQVINTSCVKLRTKVMLNK